MFLYQFQNLNHNFIRENRLIFDADKRPVVVPGGSSWETQFHQDPEKAIFPDAEKKKDALKRGVDKAKNAADDTQAALSELGEQLLERAGEKSDKKDGEKAGEKAEKAGNKDL